MASPNTLKRRAWEIEAEKRLEGRWIYKHATHPMTPYRRK